MSFVFSSLSCLSSSLLSRVFRLLFLFITNLPLFFSLLISFIFSSLSCILSSICTHQQFSFLHLCLLSSLHSLQQSSFFFFYHLFPLIDTLPLFSYHVFYLLFRFPFIFFSHSISFIFSLLSCLSCVLSSLNLSLPIFSTSLFSHVSFFFS